jgi:hypothetical protein
MTTGSLLDSVEVFVSSITVSRRVALPYRVTFQMKYLLERSLAS